MCSKLICKVELTLISFTCFSICHFWNQECCFFNVTYVLFFTIFLSALNYQLLLTYLLCIHFRFSKVMTAAIILFTFNDQCAAVNHTTDLFASDYK